MRASLLNFSGSRFARFLVSGVLNTAITYAIYLALLQFASYRTSYSIAYVAGIAVSYLLNRSFVFKRHGGWRTLLLFPLVYVAQYLFGIFTLWVWIDQAKLSETIGPLVVVALSVPLTYLLTRFVFVGKRSS